MRTRIRQSAHRVGAATAIAILLGIAGHTGATRADEPESSDARPERVERSRSGTGPRLLLRHEGPYILEDWAAQVLRSLAIGAERPTEEVVTPEHIRALIAFAHGEGGGVGDNLGRYNPLNTKKSDADLKGDTSGSVPGESFATRDFPDFDRGVEATARTLELAHYSRLRDVLLDPNSTAAGFFAAMARPANTPGNLNWSADDSLHLGKYLNLLDRVRDDYDTYAGETLVGDDDLPTDGPEVDARPDANARARRPVGPDALAETPIELTVPHLFDIPRF